MTQSVDADALPPAAPLRLEVAAREQITPRMTRVRLTGPDLAGFRYVAGQDIMLAVPRGDDGVDTINRRYTIRRHHPDIGAVDLEAVVHGDGPGARWFSRVAPGDQVDAVGPRGKVVASTTAAWHLFVADEAGLPAVAAMLGALPASAGAIAVVEVADASEEQPFDHPAGATVSWVHRDGADPGTPERLRAAVRSVVLPDGPGHVYLAAEFAVVNALRAELEAGGFASDAISSKAYWRRGTANAPHGEPVRDPA